VLANDLFHIAYQLVKAVWPLRLSVQRGDDLQVIIQCPETPLASDHRVLGASWNCVNAKHRPLKVDWEQLYMHGATRSEGG
jgi:hypothetical protein